MADDLRLGERKEGLPKQHFTLKEAGKRVDADSHTSANPASVRERDSRNTVTIRPGQHVTLDEAPFGTGVVSGTVDDGTNPIEGALVSVAYADGDHYGAETETAADGTYSIALLPGDYTLTYSADGFNTATADVTVTEDTTTTQNQSLTAA